MKVSAFYVNQKQQTITEKDVKKAIVCLTKVGISSLIITEITPMLMELVGTPITVSANSGLDLVIQEDPVNEAVDKIVTLADQFIHGTQRIAEPVAYGFCMKGFLEKMSGQDNIGTKHIKDSIKGYVMIQVLPFVFDIINVFR